MDEGRRLTEPERAELAALRERAYGPAADIADDPAAAARLDELEAARAAESSPSATATSSVDDERARGDGEPERPPDDPDRPLDEPRPASDTADTADTAMSPARRPARERFLRRLPALAAVALVVAAVLGGVTAFGWTWLLLAPVSQTPPGVERVAVLTADPSFDVGDADGFFWMGDATGFAPFEGLLVVAVEAERVLGSGDEECLALMRRDDYVPGSDTIEGPVYWDCGAGSFPASVQFVVDAAMPDELRARFPDGTALRFDLDGTRVVVSADGGAGADAVSCPECRR